MQTTELGHSGVVISRIVYGAMAPRAGLSDALRKETLLAAIDAGITSIDTAPLYDFGHCESLIGQALMGQRQRVQLLTKVGLRWDAEHGELLFRGRDRDGVERAVRCDSRPLAVRRDVEASLQRLRTDVLDLVQVHQLDRQTPVADTMGELERLRQEGKLRAIGVSNYPPRQTRRARAALSPLPLASHQLKYSLLCREVEDDLVPYSRRRQVALLAYSPLASGKLCGAPSGASGELASGLQTLHTMARRHGASAARVALSWVLAQPGMSAAIVGASRPEQIRDAAHAPGLQLSTSELQMLGRAFAAVKDQRAMGRVRHALRRVRGLLSTRLGGTAH